MSDHGGCCDCGDLLSFKMSGFCKRHCCRPDQTKEEDLPPKLLHSVQTLFNLVVKRLIYVILRLSCFTGPASEAQRLQQTASALLVWIGSNIEVFAASRSLMCKAFLQVPLSRARAPSADGARPSGGPDLLSSLEAKVSALILALTKEHPRLLREDGLGGEEESEGEFLDTQPAVFSLLLALKYMSKEVLDHLTICILRLTYDDKFKYEFTKCLIMGYQGLCDVDLIDHRNFLTRLTVQLFNCPKVRRWSSVLHSFHSHSHTLTWPFLPPPIFPIFPHTDWSFF